MLRIVHLSGNFPALASTAWVSLLWLSLWSCRTNAAAVSYIYPRIDIAPILANQTWSPNTIISSAGSPGFFNATERWTTFSAPTYSAAISPDTEADVVKAVKLATSHKIPFLATGGRHGYTTTYGNLHDGLAIDLSHFTSIKLDKTAETITVGPGVTVRDIFDPLYNAGFDLQTGSAPCPSLIGVSLGGGVGRYQGVYGLITDALVSVRLVTANGDLIEVSRNSHPDLFWAIRGAGANFGIVTSATYKVHPLTDGGDVFVAEFLVSSEHISKYFEAVESMSPLPAELASITILGFNSTTNKTQAQVHWAYKGREDKARAALAPLLNLNLEVTQMKVFPWNKLASATLGGIVDSVCKDNINRDLYSWNFKNYSASTYTASFKKMEKYFAKYPGGRDSILQFEFFPNQAMAAVPADETAFRWRDSTGYINFNMLFDAGDNVTESASIALGLELRNDFIATSGYPELTVFVNYAHGDEKLEQIYGKDKLPRLAALKKTWDPNHAFSYNNGLPTHYP
ncbi:FAD-binding domain-containing protein [Annulohypoxylon maeteangense]|uniref:FAD-binding domain-containing protein n=1 Tax=Annulohypoxylon maeteangense TaxID=1927788 RepID=UPI0020078FBE|nr:FAD-binding domain-containing protein [Annulohypoxylon maeteangense]KAI0879965.1 FAD-binding domain-containing protein [Annulohypoxylon maeteangense]